MIDFEPNEEQQLIVETVRQFAENEIRPVGREAEESRTIESALLAQAHELGLVANALPERLGGGGDRSALTGVLIAEELAWGDLGLALAILSPALSALTLIDTASEALQERAIPPLFGEVFVPGSLALIEPRSDSDPLQPQTTAKLDGSEIVLEGTKSMVPWLPGTQNVLVVALEDGEPGLYWVPVDATGLVASPDEYMGIQAFTTAEIELHGVRIPESNRLENASAAAIQQLLNRARVAQSARAVGVSRAAFEIARDYAKERETFGAPIATRQSIAFMLADMAREIDAARLLVWEAAWRLDTGLDCTREATLARQFTQHTSLQVADGAVQVLGGHGYIRDYLPELLLRNARGFTAFEGIALL